MANSQSLQKLLSIDFSVKPEENEASPPFYMANSQYNKSSSKPLRGEV
jgi:hypothetical protein